MVFTAIKNRKLSALTSIFDYLCDQNALTHNPVKGVARPKQQANEGKTPVLSAEEARQLFASIDTSHIVGLVIGQPAPRWPCGESA
jgi:site-specific recombinase XerC